MKSFKQHLNEKHSMFLYHLTPAKNLSGGTGILKSGLRLSRSASDGERLTILKHYFPNIEYAESTKWELLVDRFKTRGLDLNYFASFARNKMTEFSSMRLLNARFSWAYIKYDGRRVSDYGKIIPVSYWQDPRLSESEDRFIPRIGVDEIPSSCIDTLYVFHGQTRTHEDPLDVEEIKSLYPSAQIFTDRKEFLRAIK